MTKPTGAGGTGRTLMRAEELIAARLIAPEAGEAATRVAARYAVALSPEVVRLIDRADPADPIARQYLPDVSELDVAPEERVDPIGDDAFSPVKGVVHRYPDRVLLKPVSICPVYCRFCFRRETVGKEGALGAAELARALDYIRNNNAIWEVILTGGDPLMLSARRLKSLLQALAAIPHVRVLRIHSRVPVAAPERITRAVVAALRTDKPLYLVLHCNHPRELSQAVRAACRRLANAGLPLLSQSVLLRGVNDSVATLEALMRALIEAGIKPYYLHHPDLVPGTARFRLSIAEGRRLVQGLRGRLSGLAQPLYVLDIPGGHGKVPIGPDYVRPAEAGYEVSDFRGISHPYPEG
jgi:lysine 2,3-aminomutase